MTNYSLLYPDGATRARNGEMSVEGEDKRCAYTLGRSKWPKKHQKIPEGYSKLSYNTG